MGSGYIQLLAVGSEVNIFNYNPNISFFKIYYRRHTNFYINNMEIDGNNLLTTNNKVTFVIPKNGDLMGKSYLNLTIDDHYFELFKFNDELVSTININLLNVYDCFYIKVNNFSINDIKNISIIKINFFINNNQISIISSNLFNQVELLNYIKSQNNIVQQMDVNNIFYNMDLNLLFYSFNNILIDPNILNDSLFQYLIKSIIYTKLSYIQIDFKEIKISIRITYLNDKYYKVLLDLILSNTFINDINQIKIDINYVYLSLIFSNELYNLLLDIFYVNAEIFEFEIINDKIKSSKQIFTEKINHKINSMILNKNYDTNIYLSILNGDIQSYSILTIMEKVNFFGNLTNETYNDLLIQNSNELLNTVNLNSDKLSMNLLIKIYVSLVCYNKNLSIENFLKIVNGNNIITFTNILKEYVNNLNTFNNKLIEFIMDPNVLIVNNNTFYLILYSKNIYENFKTNNYTQPFTNNHISYYTSTIENFCFNKNTIQTSNNLFNNNSHDNNYVVSLFLFLGTLSKSNIQKAIIDNDLTLNYINNNNLFDIVSNNTSNIINQNSNKNIFFNYLYTLDDMQVFFSHAILNNSLLILITQSMIFNNENFNNIKNIYDSTGKLSKLFINSNKAQIVFPCSSSIYVFTNNKNSVCDYNKITNNKLFYNRELNDYINDIKVNLVEITNKLLNDIKINILNTPYNFDINKYIKDSKLYEIIIKYYTQTSNLIDEINMGYVDNYLEQIKNIEYNIIYPFYNKSIFDLNNIIMYQQFTYVDKNLFNSSFTNFTFNKYNQCNDSTYKTNFINEVNFEKFIFTVNSPLYRIYFYFTFIAKFSIDLILYNVKIENDINTLRDLLLSFIFYYFNIFNNLEINNNIFFDNMEKFNLQKINNYIYYICTNFMCYDNINIFKNDNFMQKIINKNSNKYLFMYNNFYYMKTNLSYYKINNVNYLNNIPNICDGFSNNYDDIIILLFIEVLNDNKEKFMDFNNILNFTLDFFNKNQLNFDKIYEYINYYVDLLFSNTNNTFSNYNNDNFYYMCYYTSYVIGSTFDNINSNNVQTINNIMSITSLYDNQFLFDYEYSFKEYNSKQYNNFLDTTNNIIDVFKYFGSKLFNIFTNSTYIDENYFNNYIILMISYVNTNQNFLLLYLISEFDYNNSLLIINSFIYKFNTINNTNISLSNYNNKYNKTYGSKFNFIVIIYYYIYFIYKCMEIDINNYNIYLNALNALNVNFINSQNSNLIISFGEFIVKKYTNNIYNNCIESLVKLFTNISNFIDIDFSTFYYYLTNANIFNKNSIISEQNIYTNIFDNNQEINDTFNNLNYSPINYYYCNVFNYDITNNNIKLFLINKNFNLLYSNVIINLIYKTNKIFYSIQNDRDTFTKITNNENLPLEINYNNYKIYYYNNSIYYLASIYNNLNGLQNIYKFENKYEKRIITYISHNLKNFFDIEKYNYFNTLYYLTYKNENNQISINNIIQNYEVFLSQGIILNDDLNVLTDEISTFNKNIDIYTIYSFYINGLIINSLIYEQSINRIIYILCTNYLIDNSVDKNYTKNILYKKTLYDIVKLYIGNSNSNIINNDKIYLNDTSIYSNQSIFQIYNYENLYNNLSFTQNYWINNIISNINVEINEINSYYNLYLKFYNYVQFFELYLFNFKLDDGVFVLTYFKNPNNYDELMNYIFNYISLNEPYSPNLIFIDIINLLNTNIISSKLTINTNHLKKKITIFLFFTWIILNETTQLLLNFFEVNKNIILEYNLDHNTKSDVELSNVLNYKNNMEIINWVIYQIYNIEPTNDNKKLIISNYPDFLNNNLDIITITKKIKVLCSPIINFNLLCDKYVNNYYDIIGDVDIYTDKLFVDNTFKPTLTNLVHDINVIFNNDINKNNPNQYDLTFYSLKLLGMNFNSLIYDLNNTISNKLSLISEFTFHAKIYYSKTVINDFNLLYNLSCLLLNNYSINYSNLNTDYNLVQNYLRKGTNSVNELFEIFKGYISSYTISSELTSIENNSKYNYLLSKLQNIQKLNNIVSYFNNLSLITPNDYDNLPILINYGYSYKKFYNKYYSYNYNYNNYDNNYISIYKKLYSYYLKIIKNTNAIKNIKNYNMNLYIWLFIDLINSFISNVYYNTSIQNSDIYIDVINQIIKLYFTYNYSFRLNQNISNIRNLIIQKNYSNVPTFNNYIEIDKYLLGYYYYQLFSTDINDNNSSNFKEDVILFFKTLIIESNINFTYIRNFLNCIFKFEVISRFIKYKIKNIYNIDIHINDENIIKSTNTLIDYITNIDNISSYFNIQYFDKSNVSYTHSYYENLFTIINNLIEKKIFFNKFAYSLTELIYWINDKSYDVNVINTWTKYFSNVYFEYYVFIDNQFTINKYTIDILSFYYLINTYIYYILVKNTEYLNNINDEYINIYQSLFNQSNLTINPDIINNIISLNYDSELFLNKNQNLNLYIDKQDENYNLKLSTCINNIFKFILNNYWGIIEYNIIENVPQNNLRSYITFYNMYYSYLNYLINNSNANSQNYNFEYNLNIFDELYILYIIIINIYTIQYFNLPSYYALEQQYLTNSHQYIKYTTKISSLNLISNFAVYMDNLNSNIIPNNTINNYYKIIQNNSIHDCIKYKLYTFKNNKNNFSSYTVQIYNNQIVKLNFNDENTLSSNTFYNIIINTFSNLTANVNIYLNNIDIIIDTIINVLCDNIGAQFSLMISNLGGNNNDSISINSSTTKKLFNQNNFKNENQQITIFTLINNQIIEKKLSNNIPILLFYYNCFNIWSTLGLNIKCDLNYINDIFYNLTNIINTKILSFLNNTLDETYDLFFSGLNILLFNNYNNYEFIKATTLYFNKIIMFEYDNLSDNNVDNLIKINDLLMGNIDNHNVNNTLNKIDFKNNILLLELKNNKIINYKYLLGLVSDFNESKLMFYIKSIDNVFNDIKVQQKLIDYVVNINNGIINDYGIIQLINKMELLFDDEIISQYFNFNYKVFIDNFQNINKQGLLNKMLNLKESNYEDYIVSGLKPYIKFSYKYNFIVPIKFFFENYFNSIPLISCMNTNIKIITYLNNTNIYKKSYFINNLTPINIQTKLNIDFILLERDERIKLCSKKIDNLIERNNYYELVKNISNFLIQKNNIIDINFDFELDNSVKEIIWTFKITIDNYEITISKNITIEQNFFSNFQNITLNNLANSNYDFIINTKFYLDGLRRDGILFLDSNTSRDYNKITTILNPYKSNTKVNLNKYYNTYSFALEPTNFQPSGTINMSNYKIFRIQIQIDKTKFLKYLYDINTLFDLKDVNFKIILTTYEYNIVRYQSSLAGLLFIS